MIFRKRLFKNNLRLTLLVVEGTGMKLPSSTTMICTKQNTGITTGTAFGGNMRKCFLPRKCSLVHSNISRIQLFGSLSVARISSMEI